MSGRIISTITDMDDKTAKTACALQGCVAEQLELVRHWLEELEGSNRRKAFELMNQVMDVKMTNKEAFALLGSKRD
jgi:hypothetical protein